MPTNRYCPPLYMAALEGLPGRALERIPLQGGKFYEDWLQRQLFEHPEILPFREIDPSFAPAIPLCRELPTDAGRIDLAYTSDTGRITLIECKLWRNPEAPPGGDWPDSRLRQRACDLGLRPPVAGRRQCGRTKRRFPIRHCRRTRPESRSSDFRRRRNSGTSKRGVSCLRLSENGIRKAWKASQLFCKATQDSGFHSPLWRWPYIGCPPKGRKVFIVQRECCPVRSRSSASSFDERTMELRSKTLQAGGRPARDDASGPRAGHRKLSLEEIYKQLSSVNPDLAPAVAEFLGSCKDRGIYPSVNRTPRPALYGRSTGKSQLRLRLSRRAVEYELHLRKRRGSRRHFGRRGLPGRYRCDGSGSRGAEEGRLLDLAGRRRQKLAASRDRSATIRRLVGSDRQNVGPFYATAQAAGRSAGLMPRGPAAVCNAAGAARGRRQFFAQRG